MTRERKYNDLRNNRIGETGIGETGIGETGIGETGTTQGFIGEFGVKNMCSVLIGLPELIGLPSAGCDHVLIRLKPNVWKE